MRVQLAVAVAISVALVGACAQARMLQQATVIVVNQPQVIVPVRMRQQAVLVHALKRQSQRH